MTMNSFKNLSIVRSVVSGIIPILIAMGCSTDTSSVKPSAAAVPTATVSVTDRTTTPIIPKARISKIDRKTNAVSTSKVSAVATAAPQPGEPLRSNTVTPIAEPADAALAQSTPLPVRRDLEQPLLSDQPTVEPVASIPSPVPSADASVEEPQPVPTVQNSPTPTATAQVEVNSITGRVSIDFRSRSDPEDSDFYKIDLLCSNTVKVRGLIVRSGRKVSSILGREQQPLQLKYDLNFSAINPIDRAETKRVGEWTGALTIDREGRYTPKGLIIDSSIAGPGKTSAFSGSIVGKAEDRPGFLGSVREYTRVFGKKRVSVSVKKSDPLEFKNLEIAGGPLDAYIPAKVNGNLDYDYDTGNWLTDGIVIQSGSRRDTITGSIKWIEDENRLTNGKGTYKVNLRYNEQAITRAQDEGSFFESMSDEEAFFAVDPAVPTISGTISYKDTLEPGEGEDEPKVLRSEVTYDIQSNGLDKRQMMTFLKLWLLISGPVNDE